VAAGAAVANVVGHADVVAEKLRSGLADPNVARGIGRAVHDVHGVCAIDR
jgi:hypothetical protein